MKVYVAISFDSRMLKSPNLAPHVRMASLPYERVVKLLNSSYRKLVFVADDQHNANALAKSIPIPTSNGINYTNDITHQMDQGDIMLVSGRPGNIGEWIIVDVMKDVEYALTLDTTLANDIDEMVAKFHALRCALYNAPSVLRYSGQGELSKLMREVNGLSTADAAKDYVQHHGKRKAAYYRERFVCTVAVNRVWG